MPEPKREYVPNVRVRRETLRIFQMAAAWRNMTIVDYLEYLAKTQGLKDLKDAQKGISEMGGN